MKYKYISGKYIYNIDLERFILQKNPSKIMSDYFIPEQVEIIHNKKCSYNCKFCYYNNKNKSSNYIDYLEKIFYKDSYPGLLVRINLNDQNDDIIDLVEFFKSKNSIIILQVISKLFLNKKNIVDQYSKYIDVIDVTPTKNIDIKQINQFKYKYDYCKTVISLVDKIIRFDRLNELEEGLYHYKPFINRKGELEFTQFNISHLQKHDTIVFSSIFGFDNGVKLLPEILVNRKPQDSLVIDLVDKIYYTQYNLLNKINLFKNDNLETMYKKALSRKTLI